MSTAMALEACKQKHIVPGSARQSDYFACIREVIALRDTLPPDSTDRALCRAAMDEAYGLLTEEIKTNTAPPNTAIKFGTSGWRGILGKDLNLRTVRVVTQAIVDLYRNAERTPELHPLLELTTFAEAQTRGCVLGHDNRFGNDLFAAAVQDILTSNGIRVFFAGESTTGSISAAVLQLKAAFSINLTPSHNPLEYGGFKFNAADGGPAQQELTSAITAHVRTIEESLDRENARPPRPELTERIDIFALWQRHVVQGRAQHGLDYHDVIHRLAQRDDFLVVVDCVHGASRRHVEAYFHGVPPSQVRFLRTEADPTFGGIAPEPSANNFHLVMEELKRSPKRLKLGVLIDPDADRIRFTDGTADITMNQFGAMAYSFLHELRLKKGLVAKTVATSNFANALADAFGERVFEPRVGFKEFKPVFREALVCFEESDGISVIGHTPEKDAYIGLLLALDMILTQDRNLGETLLDLQRLYGFFYPDRDGVAVSKMGGELLNSLAGLDRFHVGDTVTIGTNQKCIKQIITIDGHKLIFEDDSWLMIRPSGTEPKVRFYVEGRTMEEKEALFKAARAILRELNLLPESERKIVAD